MRASRGRFSLAVLMGFIVVIALSLAAIRHPTGNVELASSAATLILLSLGLLGAIVRPAPAPAFRGFALFGWGYLALGVAEQIENSSMAGNPRPVPALTLPTAWLAEAGVALLHPIPRQPEDPFPERSYDPIIHKGVLAWPEGEGSYKSLTPAEAKSWADYLEQADEFSKRRGKVAEIEGRSANICHSQITLIFALIGAIAGKALACEPALLPVSEGTPR